MIPRQQQPREYLDEYETEGMEYAPSEQEEAGPSPHHSEQPMTIPNQFNPAFAASMYQQHAPQQRAAPSNPIHAPQYVAPRENAPQPNMFRNFAEQALVSFAPLTASRSLGQTSDPRKCHMPIRTQCCSTRCASPTRARSVTRSRTTSQT